MLDPATADFPTLRRRFRWHLPRRFNIGVAVSDAWAARDPHRPAILAYAPGETLQTLSFGDLARRSSALAAAMARRGVGAGDRIGIVLGQGFAAIVTHVAIYKLGAIAVPLAALFGVEALEYRLMTAGVRAIVTHAAGLEKISAIAGRLPALDLVICADGASAGALALDALLAEPVDGFVAADTGPDDPAMMIFTSGTTGPPKGALHGHRVLLGHLPGIAMHHRLLPQPGDLMWTPADWAWAGGLLNALLPALHHGVPVVAGRFSRFDPQAALALMEELGVRNAFIPPTALRMMKTVPDIGRRNRLALRSVGSAGEALGRETYDWSRTALGVPVDEFYGQTECNIVLSCGSGYGVSRAGSTGKPVPGHEVAIIDDAGQPLPAGEIGQIAVRAPDPVMFLGYWQNEEATRQKFVGDWMTTGDQAVADPDGYVHFVGRDDDVITSAGFRIGPSEVEDCLTGHPAVALAAVVGKPDRLRTEIVKAYVVLKDGHEGTPALGEEIARFVRDRLSAHEYPREVAFVDSIPMTTSGKVIRRIFRERARREAG